MNNQAAGEIAWSYWHRAFSDMRCVVQTLLRFRVTLWIVDVFGFAANFFLQRRNLGLRPLVLRELALDEAHRQAGLRLYPLGRQHAGAAELVIGGAEVEDLDEAFLREGAEAVVERTYLISRIPLWP